MKNTNRRYSRSAALLLIVCLAALVTLVPSGSSTQARQAQPGAPLSPVGTGFTYQGRLKDGANPANGQYDLTFKLYDTGGNQVGSTLTVSNQTISEGLFTVQLDFGVGAFTGDARWLEIAVRPTGGGTYTTLSPRQPLTAAPYSMSLVPGATIAGALSGDVLHVSNEGSGAAIAGWNQTGRGVLGVSGTGDGVYGWSSQGNGAFGQSSTGYGVRGESSGSFGVYGVSSTSNGVYGQSQSDTGVTGYSVAGANGVYGQADADGGIGVHGIANNGTSSAGVKGESQNGYGVRGSGSIGVLGYGSANGWGVEGWSSYGRGVYGLSGGGYGVYGQSGSSDGVSGYTQAGFGYAGLYGLSDGSDGAGVYGEAEGGPNAVGIRGRSTVGYAGYFDGNVHVQGTLSKSAGSFMIDDPIDPANKYLYHSFVESPDMMNIYNGNVTLDGKGEATVQMPDWFEALNKDFRYQLTAIGAPGPSLYVAQEISANQFRIAGGTPGGQVSWQVTGVRHDPYAEKNRIPVEEDKATGDKGKYLYPQGYGQPDNKAINYWPQTAKPQEPKP